MRNVQGAITTGFVEALDDTSDALVIVVDSDEQNEKVSEEHRVENALFITGFAAGYGHSVWVPKQIADDRLALEAVGRHLALEINAYRFAVPTTRGQAVTRWLTPPEEGDVVGLIEALDAQENVVGTWREGEKREFVVPNGVTIESFRITTNRGGVAIVGTGFVFPAFGLSATDEETE